MFVCVGTFWRQLKLVKEAASKKKVGGRGYRGFTPEEVDTASGIGLLILVPFKRHLLSLVLHKVKCICAQVCASMVRGNQNFQILVGHTNRISGSYLRTGFPPGFFLCIKNMPRCWVPRTGTRCRCRFLSQLSQCKNAPKTPGLAWVHAGSTPPCPNRHESGLGSHIPKGTLCNWWLFQPYQQSESHPWTTIYPRRYWWICPLEVYMLKKLGSRKESIQFKGQKERNLDMRLCWCGCIMIQTWSDGDIFVEQGERVSEMNAISFLEFIVCHNEETGNTTQRVFCVCVCVCVCVCTRVGDM